jgi:hypothetical protein
MAMQHIENLFRTYRGQAVSVRTISGGLYAGQVIEVTNDYVVLREEGTADPRPVIILFQSIESLTPDAGAK